MTFRQRHVTVIKWQIIVCWVTLYKYQRVGKYIRVNDNGDFNKAELSQQCDAVID